MVEINHGQCDECPGQHQGARQRGCQGKVPCQRQGHYPGDDLQRGIAQRNSRFTVGAFAPQYQVADDRDVLPGLGF